jgi:hypothetical protein
VCQILGHWQTLINKQTPQLAKHLTILTIVLVIACNSLIGLLQSNGLGICANELPFILCGIVGIAQGTRYNAGLMNDLR